MNTHDRVPKHFLGCDVSKESVTFHDSKSGQAHTIANEAAKLKIFLKAFGGETLAVCEATGGYEATLLRVLDKAEIPAHRADAVKVKAFIRSFGIMGKSDAIDARALSDYGRERHDRLKRWDEPDAKRLHLQALAERRSDLVAMRQAEKNRLKAPGIKHIAASVRQVITMLDRQILKLETDIKKLVAGSETLSRTVETMTSLKGVGNVTAINLCAFMPELGAMTRRQAAALAGLAPHPNQSGNADNYRRVRGGRPQIRRVLFMATLVATRYDPLIKAFYNRLLENGKKPIVAITAAMRKIITILNARVREQYSKQMS